MSLNYLESIDLETIKHKNKMTELEEERQIMREKSRLERANIKLKLGVR